MNDPRVLAIISVIFGLLGLYNISLGRRKMREALQADKPIRWYKQVNVLTGVEYILLTMVFLLSVVNQYNMVTPGLRTFTTSLYFILLLTSAAIAYFVIRQALQNTRTLRATTQMTRVTTRPSEPASEKSDTEEHAQRQRERRKKAAAARRRRAGKA